MAYFPMFIDLAGKNCLIIGGGAVASRKVEKLLPYGPTITVVAPHFCEELLEQEKIIRICRKFVESDINPETDMVIAASDSREVNHAAAAFCRLRHLPINVVDDPEECSFLFPSLVLRGDLSVGISTSGASPSAAIELRQQIESLIPSGTEEILIWLRQLRTPMKERFPEEKKRTVLFRKLWQEAKKENRPLTEAEMELILSENT